jgi:hypothetical protein
MKWRALSVSPRFALLFAALSFAPTILFAQAQATTGVIRGVATDSSGNPVSAFITVRNTETNYTRTVKASDQGVFAATLLPLGNYQVSARAVGYSPVAKSNIAVTLGQTVDLPLVLARSTTQLAGVTVIAQVPTVDPTLSAEATHLPAEVVGALPNNGRNYLNLTLLTPNVAVTQGPDGDVLSVGGQRGIHNNVSVDGADFNNPFFGEQRGGQRPPFTFNLDAVREMVVVAQGANAEFGRSSGGFVNVITKSGTNNMHGTLHYFGKGGPLSSDATHANLRLDPDFTQHQFGATLGGPIVKDKFFYFLAYDQQIYNETKQKTRPSTPELTALTNYLATAFGGALAQDFGPIQRTNDANVALAKLDWRINEVHNASLKYNYTNSRQENGTFDVDTWGRSANAIEKDYSNAINGSLVSHLTNTIDNEFRFQFAREDRPRPYSGPLMPGATPSGRPFPDTGMDFASGFRFGMPFFIPVKSYDTRIQALDNISWVKGNHIFKTGFEWNKTEEHQTFIGFANGRFIFNSVAGFQNYVANSNYIECTNALGVMTPRLTGACPLGESATGPVLLYLQFAGVGGRTVEEAGTQVIPQHDLAVFIQDNWKATPTITVNYGLRWEGQKQPDPRTPPSQVFFSPFIGRTVTNARGTFAFPSDGTIPSDMKMVQPRLGIAWDRNGDGTDVVRAAAGLYYARIPGLNLASARSTNGSIGQTLLSFSGAPLPAYNALLVPPAGAPNHPNVFVFDKDFKNPRTFSASLGYEKEVLNHLAASVAYTYAATDNLTRFIDRNDAVFGTPWSTGLTSPADPNGVGSLTTIESTAKSRYNGVTFGLGRLADPDFQFQANYTLAVDKSDDDNERDPFTFRYARADRLDREYNYSDRDQRHRLNLWALNHLPWDIYANNRFSFYSAQPTSEKCGVGNVGTGVRATTPQDRICPTPTIILLRNTIRRDNAYASWDIRLSKAIRMASRGDVEAILEVFNVLNRDNFKDPSSASLLFNFDGTIRNGLGDPRQLQLGIRYGF